MNVIKMMIKEDIEIILMMILIENEVINDDINFMFSPSSDESEVDTNIPNQFIVRKHWRQLKC